MLDITSILMTVAPELWLALAGLVLTLALSDKMQQLRRDIAAVDPDQLTPLQALALLGGFVERAREPVI